MIVYKIINKLNGKGYVGITKGSLWRRWAKHIEAAQRGQTQFICCAIRKHGSGAFAIVELANTASLEELFVLERQFIAEHKTYFRQYGYNMTIGGDGTTGRLVTKEVREKLRAAAIGKKHSSETIAKRAASLDKTRRSNGDHLRLEKLRIALVTTEYKNKKRCETALRMKNPLERSRIAEAMKKYRADPDIKAKYSALMSARNALGNNQSRKTHCPRGHEYTKENTYRKPSGWRRCRICARAECKERRKNKARELGLLAEKKPRLQSQPGINQSRGLVNVRHDGPSDGNPDGNLDPQRSV